MRISLPLNRSGRKGATKFHRCAARERHFSIYVKCQVASSPRFVYRETRQLEKIRKGTTVSFFLLGVTPPGGGGKARPIESSGTERVLAGSRGIVKLFSPRIEELLSNIHGSIWYQTVPWPSVSTGFRKMFRKRAGGGVLLVNCIFYYRLIEFPLLFDTFLSLSSFFFFHHCVKHDLAIGFISNIYNDRFRRITSQFKLQNHRGEKCRFNVGLKKLTELSDSSDALQRSICSASIVDIQFP